MTMSRMLVAPAIITVAFVALMQPAEARHSCFVKAAQGTGLGVQTAKFQTYQALLQATDWGIWLSWMATRTTPGYRVGTPTYRCGRSTGLGLTVTCRAHARICKI